MKGKRKFLFFCMIFVANCAFSQLNSLNPPTFKPSSQSLFYSTANYFPPLISNKVISPDFYSRNMGFFCRQEIKLEKATKIPFKFRLGSVQYCDWLEAKKGASGLVK
ncbi:MAG TPA: hypothetical protein VK498_04735 [Ferruginibacter sp.]|nr:hypothetical protein [Ferruginibacter sp.]